MKKRFEEIDHGGDVGIEAWGEDTAGVLENATLGLFSLMVRGGVNSRIERALAVSAQSEGDLVVDWLSEVISTAGTRGEVYCEATIQMTDRYSVRGVIRGEPIDARRHELRFDVKAATYHGLLFERGKAGCRVRVIFDL
jgi:SHS2 domain-containing protein